MKSPIKFLPGLAILATLAGSPILAQTNALPVPPQDQGLPYTRSAQTFATAQIKNAIAVFPGSRYGWVKGFKVRLNEADWRAEAVWQNGKVLVPAAFAGVLELQSVNPAPAPEGLADRWVYTLDLPPATPPVITLAGKPYVDLAAVARTKGLKTTLYPRGLLLIGAAETSFNGAASNRLDSVITLFDSPEKFADPDIAAHWIPTLRRQGNWTNYVKVTPEQWQTLTGPETVWPATPKSAYDFSGFDKKLLGSAVPPPGVYPRVLFSPQDVPALAARVRQSKLGQKSLIEMQYLFEQSWWNTNTSDGQVFQKLASGNLTGLAWPDDVAPQQVATINTAQMFRGEKPGIFNTHIAYVPECLTDMALYCLLTDDDVHGRQTAAAIASYYRLREPLIDQWNALSDSEFGSDPLDGNGSSTAWRGMHGLVAHMNLGLALDFGGKWMTAAQKDLMRRVIAKATYGRRAYGEDTTIRFRDVNWVGWDLPQFLALTAIEGLPGFDREAWECGRDTVRAFCDWGIDDTGVVFESNGKTPGSFQFITLSMVSMARRGDNLFGHPHWRKLLTGQTQMTSPSGRVTVNSGTQYEPYSRQFLSLQLTDELKTFYPRERLADYLLTKATEPADQAVNEYNRGWVIQDFNANVYQRDVAGVKRLRLPSPTYPGFVPGVLYDSDFTPTRRSELNLPLDFDAPVQGVFSSYSDRTTNAVWINMMVRPNHYLGAGHHHADAGMFHFSGLGVDWFTQSPFDQVYDGNYYNLVQVDGISEPVSLAADHILGWNAAAKYLGATSQRNGAVGSAELTYAYSYRWLTQPPQEWTDHLKSLGWEVEPSPDILKIFAGTADYKMRPWWLTANYANYLPTCRAPFNPMQHVFRTVGLVRGQHPYGLVVDDVRKDSATHLYQWAAMLNGGVWQADVPGLANNQVVLAYRSGDPDLANGTARPAITPVAGEPLLLVCGLGLKESHDPALPLIQVQRSAGPADRNGKPQYFDRLVINQRSEAVHFRVLLLPFHAGEPLPAIVADAGANDAALQWPQQADDLRFVAEPGERTHLEVLRAGREIFTSK